MTNYKASEANRIQLFIYSVMAANFYAIINVSDSNIVLLFLISLMFAVFSFLCWYLQEMVMVKDWNEYKARKESNESEEFSDSIEAILLHLGSFIAIFIATVLTFIGGAYTKGLCHNYVFLVFLISLALCTIGVRIFVWVKRSV